MRIMMVIMMIVIMLMRIVVTMVITMTKMMIVIVLAQRMSLGQLQMMRLYLHITATTKSRAHLRNMRIETNCN